MPREHALVAVEIQGQSEEKVVRNRANKEWKRKEHNGGCSGYSRVKVDQRRNSGRVGKGRSRKRL